MSYPHFVDQPATPPQDLGSPFGDIDTHIRRASEHSLYTDDASSPDFIKALPTPVKSPIRQHGPLLLPKIRSQDQPIEPSTSPKKHRKALSCTYDPPSSVLYANPITRRRSHSPPSVCDMISPISAPSWRAGVSSGRSSPGTTSLTHSRRASASQLDGEALCKYGFPTYRQLPTYIGPGMFMSSTTIPGASTFVPPPVLTHRAQTLPIDLNFDTTTPTTTMLANLTSPNPSPSLVRQINMNSGRGSGQTHFWWDIRNLRAWSDFGLETIDQIPGLMRLLTIELPETALPNPTITRSRLQPETESSLHDLCRDFYGAKINAALAIAQGQSHMVMRSPAHKSTGGGGPHFVSNYIDDVEKTIAGDGRGRIVGIVRSYDRWNTGMRSDAPHRKVEYLLGLAHLHRHMREHGCRYGFIMTEIELVCVRAGTEAVPHFGYLELAPAIRLNSTSGLTACLALWFLHMLAKEVPLPGQAHWKMDVGGAAACTRQKCLAKDAWIPEPQLAEKREAKRSRGYVFCTDPLHRRELPRAVGRRLSTK
ncbi:MAG: hypothetical protein M1816_003558 [Peltula sp. TS41687]|nr:MAG: hypothetical protein M1816_003558 [Peltula sp. TS41687]